MTSVALEEEHTVVAYQAPRIVVMLVGVGGTGGWAAASLVRQVRRFNRLWKHAPEPRAASLILVDDDLVEARNIERGQNFCPPEIGQPKAQVLANRFTLAFNLHTEEIRAVVAPFSASLVPQAAQETLVILVGCVDNAEARKSIAQSLENQTSPSRVWWIDAGNERDFGQILCGNTARLPDLAGAFAQHTGLCLPSPVFLAPALVDVPPLRLPQETTTRAFACGEGLVEAGEEQSAAINFHMAALVAASVDSLLHGGMRTFATYTNLATMQTHSAPITALSVARALGQSDPTTYAHTLLAVPGQQTAMSTPD